MEARARQLGLRRHVYLSLLISNYLNQKEEQGRLMSFCDDRLSKVKRLRVQMTLPTKLRHAAQKAASKKQLSFSRFVEYLIISDAFGLTDTFTIYPADGQPKPKCKLSTSMAAEETLLYGQRKNISFTPQPRGLTGEQAKTWFRARHAAGPTKNRQESISIDGTVSHRTPEENFTSE